MFRNIVKLSAISAGVVASIAGTVAVVNAKSNCDDLGQKNKRYSFPEADLPNFKKWNWNWDRLEPGSPGIWPESNKPDEPCSETSGKSVPKARRNIILVRHGQYNTDDTDDDKNHTLTALGQEQAALTGQKLNSMGIKFDSITSSKMIRAIQTACTMLENMKTQDCLKLEVNDPLLNEGVPTIPEPPYRRPDLWCPEPRDVLVDGSRIESAFRKYFHRADPSQEKDSWEIIVCHGNVIRYFACRALQFPPEGWLRISIDHCSIARFTILPTGEVILRGLGDSGHIPYDKATA
ncbi:Serine/threonine-protein phosphatase PGAM5, mitochondrial [Orchesella cincta]|uniref:Serine/threonine-protein phosphatase PGAM5, mitochondrial n=1 Tax=Orchesella cincta TaxID=48709 RepID=A0A1D2NIN8_ORCCI|nr:Serine/threonine-protein phosphatase PGAM5, mitochondrial [Orchesella cincta]